MMVVEGWLLDGFAMEGNPTWLTINFIKRALIIIIIFKNEFVKMSFRFSFPQKIKIHQEVDKQTLCQVTFVQPIRNPETSNKYFTYDV